MDNILVGYCKNCTKFIKNSCNNSIDLLSGTPFGGCLFNKIPFKMKPILMEEDYSFLVGNTIKLWYDEFTIESINMTLCKANLVDKDNVNILLDLDLVYNLYEYKMGMDIDSLVIRKVNKKLNVDKIETLEDVKAILDVLDIKFNNIDLDSSIIEKIGHLLDDYNNVDR